MCQMMKRDRSCKIEVFMLNNNLIILKYNAPTIVRCGYAFQLQWHCKRQAAQTNGPGILSWHRHQTNKEPHHCHRRKYTQGRSQHDSRISLLFGKRQYNAHQGQSTVAIVLATSAMKKEPGQLVLSPRATIISASAPFVYKFLTSPPSKPSSLHGPPEFIFLDFVLFEFFPPANTSSMLFNMT